MRLRIATSCRYHSKVRAPGRFSQRVLCLAALSLALTGTSAAQQQSDFSQIQFNSNVYRVGERLTYNVNYSKFVSAAHIEVLVAGRGTYFGRDGIQLKAHVETTGVVNVALLSLNNDYTTYVYPESGLPYRAQQVVREAGRATEASIDYNQPAGTDAIPPKLRVGEFPGVYDLLSVVYRVRAMQLGGGAFTTTIRNEGEEYAVEIRPVGKELVKTNVGSFNAIVAQVNIRNGPNYNIHIFFSDDEWHVPVLITARYNGAPIIAELAGSELATPAPATGTRPIVNPATVTPPTNSRTSDPPTTPISDRILDLPFKIGEQLNYQVRLGTGSQPVGALTFSIKARGRYFNRDGLQFIATAQTTGAAGIIAVKDQIVSYVDPTTLLPFRTEVSLSEGRYHSTRNYNLDQNRGAATSEDGRDRIEIPVGTHDLISAIYAIRTFDLTLQKQNAISIMAVNRPRALLVKAVRRDTIDLNGQRIPALVLELKTDDPQPDRLQVRIWVGDDARHLPLRITAVTDAGVFRADLAIVPTNPR